MKEKNLRWRICSLALATSIALNTLTVQAEVKDKPVAKLEVMSQPQRTVYDVGEDVDLYGMKVKVTFTDGEIYVANSNDLTYQGYQPNVEGSQLILAMYGEYSVPITVTVKQGELRSISVKLNKTGVWIAGTTLTPDMFKVTAHTDSGSTRDVEDFTITPTVLTEGRNNITIDYHGETATAVIDAKKNSVQTIRIESPGKQEFDYGEGFSTQGLKVIAHFLDGSERDVTADCTVTGVNTGKLGEQYAKVEYEEKLVTYKVNVVQYIFDHIDITRWKDENVVEVYYKDREEPVVVTAQNVYIVDQDSTGTRIFLSVPSLDTGVCSMEVAKFINYAKELKDVTVCAISMDLPFALERWCQAKNNENVITLSDYKLHSFAAATATYVEELGLLTRAVFVVDKDNILRYVEYVREITDEPDYEAVLSCVKGI